MRERWSVWDKMKKYSIIINPLDLGKGMLILTLGNVCALEIGEIIFQKQGGNFLDFCQTLSENRSILNKYIMEGSCIIIGPYQVRAKGEAGLILC